MLAKTEHEYLGGEHKTFESDAQDAPPEALTLLPVVRLPGIVLFPSTTVPIRLLRPDILGLVDQLLSTRDARSPLANAIHLRSRWTNVAHIIRGTRSFGIVSGLSDEDEDEDSLGHEIAMTGQVGCVVDILWVGQDEEGWYCLGKGVSRFRVVRALSPEARPLSEVRHMKDDVPCGVPRCSFDRKGRKTLQLSRWPLSVWNLFDPKRTSSRLLASLQKTGVDLPIPSSVVSDPLALSFWMCSNLPIDTHTRQLLLDAPTYLLRVQILLAILETGDLGMLDCSRCGRTIALARDAFALSDTNIVGTFVNPSGHVMQVATFSKVRSETESILMIGDIVTEHSWFPGYGWQMCVCAGCGSHLGWHFTATPLPLDPPTFFGFRQECLVRASSVPPCFMEMEMSVSEGGVEGGSSNSNSSSNSALRLVTAPQSPSDTSGMSLLRAWWLEARRRLSRVDSDVVVVEEEEEEEEDEEEENSTEMVMVVEEEEEEEEMEER